MPSLDKITPVILTLDEEPNIGRTLRCIAWAQRVVIVDSGSQDATVSVVRSCPQADVFVRGFDSYAQQWNFGLEHVDTEWTLALDADYQLPDRFSEELVTILDDTPINGFFADFRYVVHGHTLRRSLYPPRQVLFRTQHAIFEDDGHTQRVQVEGPSGHLKTPIFHDDRKSLERWFGNQVHYARREATKLSSSSWTALGWPDRLRRVPMLSPPLIWLYVLFGRGLIFEGWPGWYYSLERLTAEVLLSVFLARERLQRQ